MSMILRPIKWFYHEFGIVSINETGRNAYFIILARTCRMFAYGTNSLILGTYCRVCPLFTTTCELDSDSPPRRRKVGSRGISNN
jgi:hypothetical protein